MTNDKDKIIFALAKGRLSEQTVKILEACGLEVSELKTDTRKLVLSSDDGKFKFVYVKPADVPTYVERGAADIGVVGKDTLLDENKDVYEMADLKLAACRMCVAGYPDINLRGFSRNLRVATKYPLVAKNYFFKKGIEVDIIKLNGSVELGPVIGLSDVIVDIVESGKTLDANGLVVLEEICPVTARLIVNKVSLKTKAKIIEPLIKNIKKAVE